MTTPELFFMNPEDKEWDIAWSFFPDKVMYNEGESLQYMGTINLDGRYYHEFRHRSLPGSNQRGYYRISATDRWDPHARAAAMAQLFPDALEEFGKLMML